MNRVKMNSYRLLFVLILMLIILIKGNKSDDNEGKDREELFRRLFKVRRAEQLAAVKGLNVLGSEEKQKKMITLMTEKIFTVILKSKEVLESSGYIPGVSSFPEEERIRDALSNILENTAMLGDVILHLPDVSQPVIRATPNWSGLLGWSLMFVNQTQLLDANTNKLIDLVCQEMNYTEKRPDYINPYKKIAQRPELKKEKEISKEHKKKKKLPRGPRLSSQQFGDL